MKIQLASDSARFVLTLNADPRNAWRCNLSETSHNARNSQVAVGGIIAPDCAALRQITVVLGQGYEPGTADVAYPA